MIKLSGNENLLVTNNFKNELKEIFIMNYNNVENFKIF